MIKWDEANDGVSPEALRGWVLSQRVRVSMLPVAHLVARQELAISGVRNMLTKVTLF